MGLTDVQIHLVDSVEECNNFLRWLSTKTEIGFDTESTGLDVDIDTVRMVQFGDQREGWSIPFERWSGLVHEAVDRFEGTYVAHNLSYDVAICRKHGLNFPTERMHDTRLMLHVVESTGSLALKNAAKRFVDPRADAGQRQLEEAIGKKGGWTWATVPYDYEPYWLYAGLDTVLTMQLKDVIWPQVQAEAPRSYELELAVSWVADKMERKGVLVDREYTNDLRDQLSAYIDQAEEWCQTHFGLYPGSNQNVIHALQQAGVEFTKYTQGGAISLDKEVLSSIDHPLAATVLARRQAQKLVSTYLSTYLELSERDGRIHPSINTVGGTSKNPFEPGGGQGVRTGRMSMSDPNLQNVPTRTKEGKRIRQCFIPSPGNTWVKCDADQIEMRLMAHLTAEPKMIEAFNAEGDFFVNMARDLFADPNFQKSDPRRQFVKNAGYAKLYGAGGEKFAKTAGASSVEEAVAFMRRFDALYPAIPGWIRQIERTGADRLRDEGTAYVRSTLTGRRHVADAGRLYTLVNYLIQGTAGEILKLKMVEADQAGLGEFMVLPVHDEIDLDVPTHQLDDVLTTLKDVMDDHELLRVPLTWSAETGTSWGQCS